MPERELGERLGEPPNTPGIEPPTHLLQGNQTRSDKKYFKHTFM